MKRFFALSRVSHAVLDIAAPCFFALLWLGHFPDVETIAIALFTALAAYIAVYALNDIVGVMVDRKKVGAGMNAGYSVEASAMRYPLARELLKFRHGLIWFAVWFALAVTGSFVLNPTIVVILVVAAILEFVYVRLLNVTYLRIVVSGAVKASGPVAAIFVVDTSPSPYGLLLVFAWVFFWEIGGQNIPADWNDTKEDLRVNAKTIPIRFGARKSGVIVLISMALTIVAGIFLPLISPIRLGVPYLLISAIAGFLLLLFPGYKLFNDPEGRQAARLFDTASYYPIALFVILAAFVILK